MSNEYSLVLTCSDESSRFALLFHNYFNCVLCIYVSILESTYDFLHTHTKPTIMFVEVDIFYFGKNSSCVRTEMKGVRLIQGDLSL